MTENITTMTTEKNQKTFGSVLKNIILKPFFVLESIVKATMLIIIIYSVGKLIFKWIAHILYGLIN